MKKRKILAKVLSGSRNIQFDEMITLIEAFGFNLARISGSHYIFKHPAIPEIVNIQNRQGKAIPYQIRQFLSLVEQYNLTLEDES